ncbi:pol [Penaeus vannamei]|uniref:Pol n=1 Tax=Penaeus vannamei TaxID=6689 RepID=A0A3R7NMV6_PENVA|nr:pol [Penaeus vannamei]
MGVTVSLKNTTLQIYNIKRPPKATATLKFDHIFAAVSNSPSILCGDFNAHSPTWNCPSSPSANRSCRTGLYLNKMLQDFPHSSLLNRHIPTHLRGGVLDLSFVSTDLLPIASLALHPYLTSDHYASTITLNIPPIQKPPTVPHWHFKKADWHKFTFILEEWVESYTPSQDLDTKEEEIVSALHHAANQAIPAYKPTSYIHSNKWYYSDRVRELRHRLIILRKTLKKHPSPTVLENFRVAQQLIRKEIQMIRSDSWLKWCESLNAHTSLHDLWQKLNLVSGKFRRQPCHPRPLQVAEGLIHTFQSRSTSSQLPPSTINRIQRLKPERETSIQVAISTPAESDVPFTQHDINQARKTSKDTAPGIDRVTYSMLNQLGTHALSHVQSLFNDSLHSGRLPRSWKEAMIHPVPKPPTPNAYRPISLLSCLGKTMERAVLTRLRHLVPHPDRHIYACYKGLGTKDNLAAIHSTLDGNDAIIARSERCHN